MGSPCCKSSTTETDLVIHEDKGNKVVLDPSLDLPEPNAQRASPPAACSAMKKAKIQEGELPDSATQALRKKKSKHLMIRKTVELNELELTPEDIEARMGAEDPDLEALHDAAEAREAAEAEQAGQMKRSANRKGTGAVPKQADPSAVQFQEEEAEKANPMKRSANRKGTGAAPKQADPTAVQFQEEEEEDAVADKPLKRVQARKGTGAPAGMGKGTAGVVIVEDEDDEQDEDEDEEAEEEEVEESPKIAPKRAKGRKGTGFVKPGQMPEEEDDEEEEASTDTSGQGDKKKIL